MNYAIEVNKSEMTTSVNATNMNSPTTVKSKSVPCNDARLRGAATTSVE